MDLRKTPRLLYLCLSLVLAVAASQHVDASPPVAEEEPPQLLGKCVVEQFEQEPFSEWFVEGYAEYEPDAGVLESLSRIHIDDVRFTVFLGTWCGDSRREVPRWLKLTDTMGFPRERVELVGVDRSDESVKRSPGGEERGLEIYRVPTIVVRRRGAEIARIVEFPVLSLERDLLAILDGQPYVPNYASYPTIRRWLAEGWLADPNVSAWGLAAQIRHVISGEGELAAAARVLLSRGDAVEAAKLSEVNCALHRESAGCQARLAVARIAIGDREGAREAAERGLRLNEDPEEVASLVELLEQTRAQEE